jgi:hypothetical protein
MNDEEPQMSYRRSYLSLTLIISYKKKEIYRTLLTYKNDAKDLTECFLTHASETAFLIAIIMIETIKSNCNSNTVAFIAVTRGVTDVHTILRQENDSTALHSTG